MYMELTLSKVGHTLRCENLSIPFLPFQWCPDEIGHAAAVSPTMMFAYHASPCPTSGKLRGMLPCLGPGRHSFLSVTLPPPPPSSQREEEEGEGEDEEGGQCLFFNDGQGGVCCIQLDS